MVTGRTLTDDGRQLLVAAGVATGVTLAATVIAALLIGGVAGTGSLGGMRAAAAILSTAAPASGAFVGARQATSVLGHGMPAAAVGLSGAMVVVLLLAVAALFADGSSLLYAVVAPVLGAAMGGVLGALPRRSRRRPHQRRT